LLRLAVPSARRCSFALLTSGVLFLLVACGRFEGDDVTTPEAELPEFMWIQDGVSFDITGPSISPAQVPVLGAQLFLSAS